MHINEALTIAEKTEPRTKELLALKVLGHNYKDLYSLFMEALNTWQDHQKWMENVLDDV